MTRKFSLLLNFDQNCHFGVFYFWFNIWLFPNEKQWQISVWRNWTNQRMPRHNNLNWISTFCFSLSPYHISLLKREWEKPKVWFLVCLGLRWTIASAYHKPHPPVTNSAILLLLLDLEILSDPIKTKPFFIYLLLNQHVYNNNKFFLTSLFFL